MSFCETLWDFNMYYSQGTSEEFLVTLDVTHTSERKADQELEV